MPSLALMLVLPGCGVLAGFPADLPWGSLGVRLARTLPVAGLRRVFAALREVMVSQRLYHLLH